MEPTVIIRSRYADIKRDLNKRSQEEVDKLQEVIQDIGEQLTYQHQGREDLVLKDGTTLPPVKIKAPSTKSVKDPVELNCYFHWPTYPPGKLRPCLVFLHGAAASMDQVGLPALHSDVWWLKRFPKSCVAVIPHCPSMKKYAWVASSVKASVLHAVSVAVEWGVDPRRVYIAGYSMGAIGTWEFCADSCEGKAAFAAGIPIAGSPHDPERASLLAEARFPVWCVHGEGDEHFEVGPTDSVVAEMAAENAGNIRYTRQRWKTTLPSRFEEVHGLGPMPVHESAIQGFADDEIFKWLLEQHLDTHEEQLVDNDFQEYPPDDTN